MGASFTSGDAFFCYSQFDDVLVIVTDLEATYTTHEAIVDANIWWNFIEVRNTSKIQVSGKIQAYVFSFGISNKRIGSINKHGHWKKDEKLDILIM